MNYNFQIETMEGNINEVIVMTQIDVTDLLSDPISIDIDFSSLTTEEKTIIDNFKNLLISKS